MSGGAGSVRRPLLVAPVSGFSAFVAAPLLERRVEELARQGVPAALLAEVRGTSRAVRAAGDEWARWKAAADSVAAVAEIAEAAGEEMLRGSSHDEWISTEAAGQGCARYRALDDRISTEAAALMLGVTRRRVLQLLADGQLEGGRNGRRRLVSRRSAVTLRDVRSVS